LDYRRVLLSCAAAGLLLWIATLRSFFADTISSPFLAVALLSILLILLRTRISWKELASVAVFFLVFAAVDLRLLGYPVSWPVWASFLGIASLVTLSFRVIWSDGAEQKLAAWVLGPAFLFVASEWMASYFLLWTEKAHPTVLDLYLYSFDATLHVQLPFLFGRLFASFPGFAEVSIIVYLGLPVAIGLAYAGCLMRDRKSAFPALVAFLITGPLGVLFYNLFPALGPIHVLRGDFPLHPLTYSQASRLFLEPISIAGPRNAIPSLHAAWAFLVVWYSRNLSRAERIGAEGFLFFTLCATLGTGEHYFVDLVVALPFSLLVVAIAEFLAGKKRGLVLSLLLTGLGITVAWLLALRYAPRFFWLSPSIPWGTCLVSVLIVFFAAKKLLELPAGVAVNPVDQESEASQVPEYSVSTPTLRE
jgi:PAP2 superfamily